MIKAFLIILASTILISCSNQEAAIEYSTQDFEEDIVALKSYFHIPGLAVLVKKDGNIIYENYLGNADIEGKRAVDSSTIFPIASITKTFASVLLLQLVEQGKLSLDEPINDYLEQSTLSDAIKVKHILSHSSEGTPGTFFNYSNRFSILTRVIEQSSNKTMEELINTRIIQSLGLKRTIPLSNQATIDSMASHLAKPYFYFGEVEAGHFDYGFSSSSGLASTVRDLAKFDDALSSTLLISGTTRDLMFTPFAAPEHPEYPYGYGIFTQTFLDKEIKWGYGQEDCFSSLLLKVPEEGLTLILLANNNLMSDPPRLINGDITYSLFAMSFLKHFVFDLPEEYLSLDFSVPANLDFIGDTPHLKQFYRQELLANALSASFMGYADSLELKKSKQLTELALSEFPDYEVYGNPSMLRLLMVLSTYGDIRDFDKALVDIGKALLSTHKHDPYTNVYLAYHYQNLGQEEQAHEYFKNIVEAPNLQPFWYTIEACDFLGDYYKESHPGLAKQYFQKIVDIGWNMGGRLDNAKRALNDL